MARKRKFGGKTFTADNFLYAEWKIGGEADRTRKLGFNVRRVKGPKYKSGTGNWWYLFMRRKK